MATPLHPIDQLGAWHRIRPLELLPWVLAVGYYFLPNSNLPLGTEILTWALFTLSLDLVLGYTGIVSLGHAAFFGIGAYAAGLVARWLGWTEPITALIFAGAVSGVAGVISGLIVLRTHGLTLLMLTMAVAVMLKELANKLGWLTGGADGLQGIVIDPIFGQFRFDMFGRTTYWYALAVLFLAWIVARRIVHSPFGRSLVGIRENATRMSAIGSPVMLRMVTVYAISAAMAGVAGALLAQTTRYVTVNVLSLEYSGDVLIMLVLGGMGRLYGAFAGSAVFLVLRDELSKLSPYYWSFGIGLLLVATVLFARGGLLGIVDTLWDRIKRWRA
ncbi:MAG: branched-chain amino acid ABC transporter permease [Alphaproteobacteria bacterium]|nr:branched-chain amino acid ABC transporter permease [Alphaproteobacteria bacterium]